MLVTLRNKLSNITDTIKSNFNLRHFVEEDSYELMLPEIIQTNISISDLVIRNS